ncbi:RusA family crossover junction endodeoxyribonuclease [Nocardia sp. NPDC051570]|uniref:RusA family crossover junction endodeoxyribonuclease n=1 Tax=Nocardia sp. NPDC051570 TaxID=3364324 RepID=UPI003799F953
MARVSGLLRALGGNVESGDFRIVTIPGPPWSKSRPLFGKGRAYKSRDDADAETRSGMFLHNAVREPYTGNVGIACLFFRQNRQRIDTDNLLKHVCDASNGVIWKDDSQCTAAAGVLELDAGNPRTVVAVGQVASTLVRGTDAFTLCKVCGAKIFMEGQRGSQPDTCSPACRHRALGYPSLSEPVPCAHCGNLFRRKTRARKLCSIQCNSDYRRERKRATAPAKSACPDCGRELSHNRGGRCRDCWKLSISKDRVVPEVD